MEKICDWCNLAFIPKHGNQKYCSDECAAIAERENARLRNQKKRQKWGDRYKIGTGGLGPHRHEDFILEYEKIRKEKQWIGIVT